MSKRLLFYVTIFFLAFGILFSSIYQSASVNYAFSQAPLEVNMEIPEVEYQLPGPGVIAPDSPAWVLEVARDKIWLSTASSSSTKTELLLLFANKRIGYAEQLSYQGLHEEAIAVAQKAEMYLQEAGTSLREAYEDGQAGGEIITEMSIASLKHRQLIEGIYFRAPKDAHEIISRINAIPKSVYEQTTHMLNDMCLPSVSNPFTY